MLLLDEKFATVDRNSCRPCEIRTTPMASTRYATVSYGSFGVNVNRAPLSMFQLDHIATSVVARSDGEDDDDLITEAPARETDPEDFLLSSPTVVIDGCSFDAGKDFDTSSISPTVSWAAAAEDWPELGSLDQAVETDMCGRRGSTAPVLGMLL